MNRDELFELLCKIRRHVWQRQNMPHKPLLVLWALKRIEDGHPERLASFEDEIRQPMRKLLERFNPSSNINPVFPFWRLRRDNIWEVPNGETFTLNANRVPIESHLKSAKGGFLEPIYDLLCGDPVLLAAVAQFMIIRYFPESQHEDVRKAIGLRGYGGHDPGGLMVKDEEPSPVIPDPRFRREVLHAYEEHCAICDYDIRLEGAPLDLEATHIRSHESGGPHEVPNGLALCGSHDAALKSGAIGLDRKGGDFVVLVSDQLKGQGMAYEMFRLFGGRPLRPPLKRSQAPNPEFVEWHRRQVFRGVPLR